ncbi:MAG: hypothetical protein HGA67_03020 [Candidatus Yonathbacteria bacterium]|nr:hypothetical protein [Candidatus Yonathbacteria bacterium]
MNTYDIRALLKEDGWHLVEIAENFRPAHNNVRILAEKRDPVARLGRFDAFITFEIDFRDANYNYFGYGLCHLFRTISSITVQKVITIYTGSTVFHENKTLEWKWTAVPVGKTAKDGNLLKIMREIDTFLTKEGETVLGVKG